MTLIHKDVAQLQLEAYFPLFRQVIMQAWSDWLNGTTAPRMQHSRVRATEIWNHCLWRIKEELDKGKYVGIAVSRIPYNIGVFVGDCYFIKFKKGDKSFKSSNYPTQLALDFHDPNVDIFGGVVRLELLYVLDKHEVAIERIVLTQRNNKHIAWALDLTDMVITPFKETLESDMFIESNKGTVASRVVRSLGKDKEKKYANSNGDDVSERHQTRNDRATQTDVRHKPN